MASVPLSVEMRSSHQSHEAVTPWQLAFESLLPVIHDQARFAFRNLSAESRSEAVQETICGACLTFARLFHQGKAESVTACSLAHFAILRCRGGRECGQRRNGQDILSPFARRRRTICVESLHGNDDQEGDWWDVLIEDSSTSPAELASFKIDYGDFLASLDPRRRQIAEVLSGGESTSRAAELFGVSAGRICQLRNEFRRDWNRFIGNEYLGVA